MVLYQTFPAGLSGSIANQKPAIFVSKWKRRSTAVCDPIRGLISSTTHIGQQWAALFQYVRGTSEELRKHFVTDEGKIELTIDDRPDSVASYSMGGLAYNLTKLIQDHDVKPEHQDWFHPNFTATNRERHFCHVHCHDSRCPEHFQYDFWAGCGFLSATLKAKRPTRRQF